MSFCYFIHSVCLLFCFFPRALTAAWHKSFIRSAMCVRMRCAYIKVIELPWHHFNSENQSFSLKAQHIFYSLFNLFIKGSTAPSAISKVEGGLQGGLQPWFGFQGGLHRKWTQKTNISHSRLCLHFHRLKPISSNNMQLPAFKQLNLLKWLAGVYHKQHFVHKITALICIC